MSETNLSKFNTLLLTGILILLVWDLLSKPRQQLNGRFQSVGSPRMALDTKTGKLCSTVAPATEAVPLCSDSK